MSRARYSAWDGTQDPFGPALPTDELVDRLSEDVLDGWGLDNAVRRLLEDGMEGRFDGLRRMRERLEQMRRARERRMGMPDPLAGLREELERILQLERVQLAADPSDDARFEEIELDTLPDSTAAQVSALRDRTWKSVEAAEAFEDLLDEVRRRMLDAAFRQISDGMRSLDPEDLGRVKDMLAELNDMLDERAAGLGPTQDRFDEFMGRYGDMFPENPATFDELMQTLARRAMAFSRLMASLTPEQQSELRALASDLMEDMDLAFQMDRLGQSLRGLVADLPWDEGMDMGGEPVGLSEGLDTIDEASRIEELQRVLAQDYPGAGLDDIDEQALRDTLGDEAARDLRRLRQIEKLLEDAGVVGRSNGRLELTPRGVRKLGERALARVFERLTMDQIGGHEIAASGGHGEPTGSSRPWRFGDPFRLDLRRTVHNAVVRSGPSSSGVSLTPEDFEIQEAERRTMVATVLLLDMSRSMPLRGHWLPAKRMALALHTLISTAFPEDRLAIVGFSDYARPMQPADLAEVDWEPVYGTNMEHAFNLAGRILGKHRDATKQVLLVTDGEPTAHLEGDHVYFNWPPVRETLEKTYREAMRLARSGVTMNIFMLEQSPGLTGFVDRLAQLVRGRVFSVNGDRLGEMIVTDYVRGR